MIAIVDYGAGNLGSVDKAFRYIGADVKVTSDPDEVSKADALVLPGVGAFSHCMDGLESIGLTQVVKDYIQSGKPFLGICIGLQMLFEYSEEKGVHRGLGVLPGKVVKFNFDSSHNSQEAAESALKIPHIGWNALKFENYSSLFDEVKEGERVYFVHSFHAVPAQPKDVIASTEYGYRFCCAVQHENVYATQFHPEKSGAVGLRILANFTRLVG
jgi:glutamine amidotransferase